MELPDSIKYALRHFENFNRLHSTSGSDTIETSIEYTRQFIEGIFKSRDDLMRALTESLEHNADLASKLNDAEQVIKTAREWKAAAIQADRRAVEAQDRIKKLEADIEYLKKQRTRLQNDYYTLTDIADIILDRFGEEYLKRHR